MSDRPLRLFVLDIETVRNALPWTPPAGRPDAFPPPPCWDIVCIGGLLLTVTRDAEGTWSATAKLKIVEATSPAAAVQIVDRIAETATLVTFNGRSFDLPVMECAILSDPTASAPRLFRKRVRGRYDDGHQDVSDYLTNHGATSPVSLDLWCRSVGLVGKGDTGGSDVAAMHAAGRIAEINAYCLSDVAQEALLFLDAARAAGELSAAVVEACEGATWEAVIGHGDALRWVTRCARFERWSKEPT